MCEYMCAYIDICKILDTSLKLQIESGNSAEYTVNMIFASTYIIRNISGGNEKNMYQMQSIPLK